MLKLFPGILLCLSVALSGCVSCESFPDSLPDAMPDAMPDLDMGEPIDMGEDSGTLDLGTFDGGSRDDGVEDLGWDGGELDQGPDSGSPDLDVGTTPDIPDFGSPECKGPMQNSGCLGGAIVNSSAGGGGATFCGNLPTGSYYFCDDFTGGLDGWCNGQGLWWNIQQGTLGVDTGTVSGVRNAGAHIPLNRFCGGFELEASLVLEAGQTSLVSPEDTSISFMLFDSRNASTSTTWYSGTSFPNTILWGYYIRVQDFDPAHGMVRIQRFFSESSTTGETHDSVEAFQTATNVGGFFALAESYAIELSIRFDPQNAGQPWLVRINGVDVPQSFGDNSMLFEGPFDYLSIKTFRGTSGLPVARLDHLVIRPLP